MGEKTTPETCGKQVENLWQKNRGSSRGIGWVVRAHAGRLPPALRLNGRCLNLARIVSGRIGSHGAEEEMPGKCRL